MADSNHNEAKDEQGKIDLRRLVTLQGQTIPDDADPMASLRETERGGALEAGGMGRRFALDARAAEARADHADVLALADQVVPDDARPSAATSALGKGLVNVRQDGLGRVLTLKSFDDVANTAAGERFRLEALVTAWLEHPNITPVHGYQALPDGRQVIEFQEVRGATWDRALARQSEFSESTLDGNLDILSSVCDAVAFAHNRGILHGNLTPEKVVVGQFGEVLVSEWMHAIRLPSAPAHLAGLRSPADCRKPEGDPRYLAPELLQGRTDLVGQATDVYHLGGLLYRILTGRPPHIGKDVSEQAGSAVKGAIVRPCRLRPEIPMELERIAMKALRLLPDKRFRGVVAFKQAISDYRQHAGSLSLSAHAWVKLRSLAGTEKVDRDVRYGDLDEVISGFQQALALWPENPEAAKGIHEARLQYFHTALDNDDLQMARMVSDTMRTDKGGAEFVASGRTAADEEGDGNDGGTETAGAAETGRLNLAELESKLAEAWAKRRRQHKILGYAAVAMLAALIIGVTIPLTIWLTMKDPAELVQAEQQVSYTLDMLKDLKGSPDLRQAVEALRKSPDPQIRAKARGVIDAWARP